MKKILIALCFLGSISYIFAQRMVITQPVIDMSVSYPAPSSDPAAPQERPCRRAHQGLFNEIIDAVETKNNQLKISYNDSVIYGTDSNNTFLTTFWINNDQAIPVDQLNQHMQAALPEDKQETIVLTLPWQGFSVGTYFKRVAAQDLDDSYAILIPNFETMTIRTAFVPHTHAIIWKERSAAEARALFLNIVNTLIQHAHEQLKIIPYVWGGSSYIHANETEDYHYNQGAWERPKRLAAYTGYDCSELIMRIAQMVGIPFPWKLSGMIRSNCTPVTMDNGLENGDIIWIQGHVMIVNDIAKNQVIEARGYKSGYGKIHRILLKELFQGVETFDDLLRIYYNKEPIILKNRKGGISKVYDSCLLFKLVP